MPEETRQSLDSRNWEALKNRPGLDYPGVVPVQAPLPDLKDMLGLPDAQLLALLERYDIVNPTGRLAAEFEKHSWRLRNVPPGAPDLEARLRESANKAALLSAARGAKRDMDMVLATGGDENQELIRIVEGDESSCDVCLSKAGAVGTWAEHKAMGTDDCLGGGNCRCEWIAVS